jgi:mRNA interferase MazF
MASHLRFDVYLVNLDPVIGHEMQKTRPCVILSPNEIHFLGTCIIAPLTSKIRNLPCRVKTIFNDRLGEVALDQLRAIDLSRLVKKIGRVSGATEKEMVSVLQDMFTI